MPGQRPRSVLDEVEGAAVGSHVDLVGPSYWSGVRCKCELFVSVFSTHSFPFYALQQISGPTPQIKSPCLFVNLERRSLQPEEPASHQNGRQRNNDSKVYPNLLHLVGEREH